MHLLSSLFSRLKLNPLVVLCLCPDLLRSDGVVVLRACRVDTLMVDVGVSLAYVDDAADYTVVQLASFGLDRAPAVVLNPLRVSYQRAGRLGQLAAATRWVMR